MAVTIKDVAKLANVAPSTVSRVLANNPKISDETKEKVFAAIKKLDYHPNIIARSLANKSTKILGLILPSGSEDLFKNPFFIKAMTGISIFAQKKGYNIMYAFSKSEKEEVKYIESYTSSQIVDGVILLTSRQDDKCISFLKKINYPFVIIGRPEDTKGVLWVDNDNFQAMYNAVNYLINKGHREIAFIGGPEELNMSKDRLDGYKKALQIHGISINQNFIIHGSDFSESCGYEAMESIIEYRVPEAVVTTDDLLAFGAQRYLNKNFDKKVSIIGFNNIPLAEYQIPPLSSVDINAEKLGYYAAKLLIGKLEDDNLVNTHYIIETDFVERSSTK